MRSYPLAKKRGGYAMVRRFRCGFLHNLRSAESERLLHLKVQLQYTLVCIFSLVCGWFISSLPSDAYFLEAISHIRLHFLDAAAFYDGFSSLLPYVFRYSAWYMLYVVALFLASFAVFRYLISDVILFFAGFQLSYSAFLMLRLHSAEDVTSLPLLLFGIKQIIIFFLIYIFAKRAAVYAQSFRTYSPTGSHAPPFHILFPFIFCCISYVAKILLICGIYCAWISWIK